MYFVDYIQNYKCSIYKIDFKIGLTQRVDSRIPKTNGIRSLESTTISIDGSMQIPRFFEILSNATNAISVT